MEGFGGSGNSKERQPWTTDMMKENRDKWNLSADVGVLEYLQQFGNNLLNETENTLNLIDSFETELNTTCIQVSNITNRFLSLADSQFVENRVYDDEETPTPETNEVAPSVPVKTKQEEEVEVLNRLKEAINNGLNVLNTKFEAVEVVNSDSEDDDDDSGAMGIVYKPINPFNNQPLPHLIGSVDFMKDPTVGLEEPASDEDDEDDDEEESLEESSVESKPLTEENDSEPESDRQNIKLPNDEPNNRSDLTDILYKQPSSSFADHLAKRLENIDNESRNIISKEKPTRNLFSTTPPPLEDSYDDDFGSSDDLTFGSNRSNNKNDDLFEPKSKSSLWDDDDEIFDRNVRVNNNNSSSNKNNTKVEDSDNRKKIMEDLEKRFMQNKMDDYSSGISPSPPPLNDDQSNDSENSSSKSKTEYPSLPNRSNFRDDIEDDDESDNLFAPSKSIAANTSVTKKKLPAGAVNIFGKNTDILKDKNFDTSSQRQQNNNDIIAKSITSLRRNYNEEDDEDDKTDNENRENDEEDDDSLFKSTNKSSSRSSSVKMSESFHDDNVSIKSNKSAGLFDDVLISTTKKNTMKKTMDDLFRDLNDNGDDDDDNLFSSLSKNDTAKNKNSNSSRFASGTISTSKSNNIDDLFSDVNETDDLFSNFRTSDNKSKTNVLDTNVPVVNTTSKKSKSIFHDIGSNKDELDSDIFSSNSLKSKTVKDTKQTPSVSNATLSASSSAPPKNISLFNDKKIDLFGDNFDDGDDLFSSDLLGKKSSSRKTIKNDNKDKPVQSKLFNEEDNDNLFADVNPITSKQSDVISKDKQLNVSEVPVENKNIKTANIKSISLFSDDEFTDKPDDLFNVNKKGSSVGDKNSIFSNKISKDLDDNSVKSFSSVADNEIKSDISKVESDKKLQNSTLSPSDDSPLFSDNVNVNSDLLTKENDSSLFNNNKIKHITKETDVNESLSIRPNNKNESELFSSKIDSNITNDDLLFKSDSSNIKQKDDSDDSLFKKTEVPVPSTSTSSSIVSKTVSQDDDMFSHSLNSNKSIVKENDKEGSVDKEIAKVNSTDIVFDDNNTLPKIPDVVNKKPEVPIKPKPEPPKSLNIRAPISTPDPFGNDSKVKNKDIKTLDVSDGCVFSSESSSEPVPSPRITPGKLNLEKTLNIDPKALLPGARPLSFKKSSPPVSGDSNNDPELPKSPSDLFVKDNSSFEKKPDNKIIKDDTNKISDKSLPATNSEVLHSIAKDRPKILIKRRPQSRKARQEAARQSIIENNDDETDNSSSITTTTQSKEQRSTSSSLFEQHSSNILSPSTDEEDLFGVPPLDLPPDYTKVSTSPGDIFDTPGLISPDDLNARNLSSDLNIDITRNLKLDASPDLNPSIDTNKESQVNVNPSKNDYNEDIFKSTDNDKSTNDNKTDNKKSSNESKQSFDKSNLFSDSEDFDLFSNKKSSSNPDNKSVKTDNTKSDLTKVDPTNIICGVFNTNNVVNICDKLSSQIVPSSNDDELFPPSDWSSNSGDSSVNKKQNTAAIVSVPEKSKSSSLFGDNLNSNEEDDDSLFSNSKSVISKSTTKTTSDKSNVNTKKSIATDLFLDDDESDLFFKSKTASSSTTTVQSKTVSSASKQVPSISDNIKIKKSISSKVTKSIFDDDDDISNETDDIFSTTQVTSVSGSSLSSSSGAIKKTGGIVKKTKITKKQDDGEDSFVDPLTALNKN